jgi:hypothetical protein
MTTTATQIEQVQDKKEFRKNKVQNIKWQTSEKQPTYN